MAQVRLQLTEKNVELLRAAYLKTSMTTNVPDEAFATLISSITRVENAECGEIPAIIPNFTESFINMCIQLACSLQE